MFFLNGWNESKWHVDIIRNTVSHEFKFSIRWDKSNRAIGVKFSETDTSVESAVVDFHSRLALTCLFSVNYKLIVQTKFAFWHASQFGVHLNLTSDFITQHAASTGEQQINTLQDINVHLISLVFDAFTSPIDRTSNLTRQLGWLRLILRADVPQIDVQAQDIDSTILRVSKIHGFIHQFINKSHVISHGVLVKLFSQIGLEDGNLLEKVLKDQGRVDVGPSNGNEVHVQVTCVQK